MQKSTPKLWLLATFAASTLLLSACEDKGSKTSENDPTYDAQTEIEQEATGVDDVAQVNENVNSVAIDDPLVNDEVAVAGDDDIGIATVDDSEVLDGSESSEHISTY